MSLEQQSPVLLQKQPSAPAVSHRPSRSAGRVSTSFGKKGDQLPQASAEHLAAEWLHLPAYSQAHPDRSHKAEGTCPC